MCAICQTCGVAIPIFEVEQHARIEIQSDSVFSYRDVPCEDCGAKHDYLLRTLLRLQAREGEPPQ
jgi:RNase P subunit RPR2